MFIICGEALFDVFIDKEIPTSSTSISLSAQVGGSPLNVAIGLARLGRNASLLTGISSDFFGDRLIAVLERENVSTRLITRKPAPTTLGFVQRDPNGQPSYSFYGENAADRSLLTEDIKSEFTDMQCLHIGSYSTVVPPTADTLYELVVRQSGKQIISLDPNIRPTVEPNLNVWRQRIGKLIGLVDVIKASDEDISLLYPEKEHEEVLEDWLKNGVKLAILTQGDYGATLMSTLDKVYIPAPEIEVADTVGAGDTFQAVLLDSLVELDSNNMGPWHSQLNASTLQDIGRMATTAAAITCSRVGADLPTRQELLSALDKKHG